MKTIKKYILPSVVVLVLIILAGWKLASNKNKMEENAAIANQKLVVFPVTVVSPIVASISSNFKVIGSFNPSHQLNFVSETSGRVKAIFAKSGDFLAKGQIIAQLDTQQIHIDLNLAKSAFAKAKADLGKFEIMLEKNAVNKQQVEDAKMAFKNAESRFLTLQRQLKISSLVSPIAGTIFNLPIEVGTFLAPGSVIAEIVDIRTLKMNVKLLDNEVVNIKIGQKIIIIPDLYPNSSIEGHVTSISPKADGARKFDVEIEFSNNNSEPLKAGMTGNANFTFGGEKKAMVIPLKCLIGSLREPKVYVSNGANAHLVSIVAGNIHDDKLEVLSGLSLDDLVVESGQLNIANGSAIEIIQ